MIIAGNWKMNTDARGATDLANGVAAIPTGNGVQVVICPPAPFLQAVCDATASSPVEVGAQNVHHADSGAFTGEISCQMIQSVGAKYVIIGHSERRQYFAETDESVNAKVLSSMRAGLIPIICVGEQLDERERGLHRVVVRQQLQNALQNVAVADPRALVVAYEPVWAIGTGKTASPDQAQEMHKFVRSILARELGEVAGSIKILYGGSMKPKNAHDLLQQEDVDGGLIGGASLQSDTFAEIVEAANRISDIG